MPVPKPKPGEKQKDFMSRCIPVLAKADPQRSNDQVVAMCGQTWRDRNKPPRGARYVTLRGLANTAKIRTAVFKDEEHLVVPVVMLKGDIVVWAMNAETPEFVPKEELAYAPGSWNGRPLVPDHPGAGKDSANTPRGLEAEQFGHVFNAEVNEDGDLVCEAWLSPTSCKTVGKLAMSVLRRAQAKETIEVSVGCWVTVVPRVGISPGGKRYAGIWRNIVPDHLAMLPEGVKGACSISDGCGAPRAARAKEDLVAKTKFSGALASLLNFLQPRAAEADTSGESANQLKQKLDEALRAVVPMFMCVDDVWPESGAVVYGVGSPDPTMMNWMHYRRSYTVDDTGNVALEDDAEQVEMVQQWQPVSTEYTYEPPADMAAAASGSESEAGESSGATMRAACDCTPTTITEGDPQGTPKEATMATEKVKAVVDRLLADKRATFDATDRAELEAMSYPQLALLAASLGGPHGNEPTPKEEPPKAPSPAPPTPPPPQPMTEEQQLAALPAGLQAMARRYAAQERIRHAQLVRVLTEAQQEFSQEDLALEPIEKLEKLAGVLGLGGPRALDFSGVALPVGGDPEDEKKAHDVYHNPPDGWDVKNRVARARGMQPEKGKEAAS